MGFSVNHPLAKCSLRQPICMEMTQNGSQCKILVFTCPYIPKTVFFDDSFSCKRSSGKNLVIDKNSIVKSEILKILTKKTPVIYLKRKLRTCRIQIQVEEVEFVTEKRKKIFLISFFQRGDPLMLERSKNTFFSFSKLQFFFEKWLQ